MGAVIYFNPSVLNVPAVGETFDVEVKARDVTDLVYFYFDIAFDASNLRLTGSRLIQDVANFYDPPVENVEGTPFIRLDLDDDLPSGVSGDIVLATLTFQVLHRVASTLSLRADYGEMVGMDDDIDFTSETGTLQVTGSRMPTPIPIKPLSYQGYPLSLTVKIHDQDVTDNIVSVDDIARSVDYPNLTEFRIGEASLTLRDVHGDFSPNNPSNFFTQNGGRRTGRHSPVEIEAGFIVNGTHHTETIFKGTLIRLVQDAKAATVKAICADGVGGLRSDAITDFGIARHFMLTENLSQSGENGFYPIMDAIMPASHGSEELATRTGESLQPVQKLATEGTLDPRNFIIDGEGVRTEGGPIVNRAVGYPQLKMKSPFRYRHIEDVITDILNHAGITDSEIAIPEQDVDAHFSSNGRVNYDLLGTIASSNPMTWRGYVTDFIFDAAESKWYFLYNRHRNNPNGLSQVIVYDEATRTYTKLHQFAAAVEVWKFTKSGNSLYILASAGGNYDANEASSENQIIQLDISGTPTETVFVPHTNARRAQLAHYYHGVGSVFMRPDSRMHIIYNGGELYYAFVDRANSNFGIAKATAQNTTEAVITINQDNYGNHAGITFDIKNNILKGATTFVSGSRSQILGFQKTL